MMHATEYGPSGREKKNHIVLYLLLGNRYNFRRTSNYFVLLRYARF